MARPLRIEYEGAVYHITSRGNERKKIFFGERDYEKFKSYLREAHEKYGCLVHGCVLMANHYHLLLETPNGNLSQLMHYVNGSYTNYINRKRGRSGHLFQGRYKAILVERDSYLLELSRYVHLNPVRAKVVAKPEEYPYSSYRSYVSREKEDLVTRDLIWGMISKTRKDAPKSYREFVERAIGEELESPLKNVYGGVILGRGSFIKEALSKLKENTLGDEGIAQRRALQAAWGKEGVTEALCRFFKVSSEELFKGDKGRRDIGIHLMKRHAGLTNREIGQFFGGLSYSAVAKAHQRFSARLAEDRSLGKAIKEIEEKMSHVKP